MTKSSAQMHVRFLEEEHCLSIGDSLTFGRSGDIEVDDNVYLHRIAGRFSGESGIWTLENVGTEMMLNLRGVGQVLPTTIPPGQQVRIRNRQWTLSFEAGQLPYLIEGWLVGEGDDAATLEWPSGISTEKFGGVGLSAGQRIVVAALAEDVLRGRPSPVFRSSKDIAKRLKDLSISEKAVERRLDVVAEKLNNAGVRGVKGVPGASADRRRQVMAEHLIRCRILSLADLELLP